jgi:hypothetical protein
MASQKKIRTNLINVHRGKAIFYFLVPCSVSNEKTAWGISDSRIGEQRQIQNLPPLSRPFSVLAFVKVFTLALYRANLMCRHHSPASFHLDARRVDCRPAAAELHYSLSKRLASRGSTTRQK